MNITITKTEEKKPQKKREFSKMIVIIVAVSAIIFFIATLLATLFLGLPETVACAIIAALGAIILTTVVWYYKKAQAENTIKLYLASYNVILKLKKKYGEEIDSTLNEMESNIIGKMDDALNESITDATSLIEQQSVG